MIALHAGIVPAMRTAHVHGCTATTTEVPVGRDLGLDSHEQAWISGSWQVWGVHDNQDVGPQGGLRVLMHLHERPTTERLRDLRWRLRLASAGSRIVDVAYVTSVEDWSIKTHVIDWSAGMSEIYVYELGNPADAMRRAADRLSTECVSFQGGCSSNENRARLWGIQQCIGWLSRQS